VRVLLNPPGADAEYLRGLRSAFDGWGGEPEFHWWFRRAVGDRAADLLVVSHEQRPVAGSAVSYRRLALEEGPTVRAGVMSGAWTLPEHRRRGHLTRLIEASREIAARRGCAVLLAMARSARASAGPLRRAAILRSETWSLSRRGVTVPPRPVVGAPPSPTQLAAWFHDHRSGAGFVYPEVEVFAEQSRLARPGTEVISGGGGIWVVIEPRGDARRVQAVVCEEPGAAPAELAAALAAGSAAFTSDPEVASAASAAGFTLSPGHVYVLPVPGGLAAEAAPRRWALQELDRA
jgi:GNAT superfamily N-acetyltransferase